jgi:FkbM family methyltransferase
MDRTLSRLMNCAVAWLTELPLLGPAIHKLFSRLLPVRQFDVRGVAIRCVIPLHQTGTFNEAQAWSRREPEVLDWLDGIGPDSVFFDIGANFGTETLYAALKPNGPARIAAFDAEFIGGYNLALNLRLNGITKATNYACAIGRADGFLELPENINYLWVAGEKYGKSCKTIAVFAIDSIVARTGLVPTHVKIDVDGPEAEIVAGMAQTLRQQALRSLMIEINSTPAREAITRDLAAAGFAPPRQPNPATENYLFERARP